MYAVIYSLPSRLRKCAKSQRGQTLVEYSIVLAVISIIAVGVFSALSSNIAIIFMKITGILDSAQASGT